MAGEDNPEIGATVQAGGIATNYHDSGSGEPVLLLHGSGPGVTAWANWRTVLPALARDFRVIAPDMVGFGYTGRPADAVLIALLLLFPQIALWLPGILFP